jgi:hypothetical protein
MNPKYFPLLEQIQWYATQVLFNGFYDGQFGLCSHLTDKINEHSQRLQDLHDQFYDETDRAFCYLTYSEYQSEKGITQVYLGPDGVLTPGRIEYLKWLVDDYCQRHIVVVTRQNMVDFINRQDPNRPINFKNSKLDQNCGCLMVQYGIENNFDFSYVGVSEWFNQDNCRVARFEFPLMYNSFGYHTTYGELEVACSLQS